MDEEKLRPDAVQRPEEALDGPGPDPELEPADDADAGLADAGAQAPPICRLEEQMQALLAAQRRLMWVVAGLAAALVVTLGVIFTVGGQMYREINTACEQVEVISGTLEESLGKLDPERLDEMMQTLPDIADRLSKIDVDALNGTLEALPQLMESVARMEEQVSQIASWFSGLGRLFG